MRASLEKRKIIGYQGSKKINLVILGIKMKLWVGHNYPNIIRPIENGLVGEKGVFLSCPLFAAGRPVNWTPPLGEEHMSYLANTVLELWRNENPGQNLPGRLDLKDDELAHPRPQSRRRGRRGSEQARQ